MDAVASGDLDIGVRDSYPVGKLTKAPIPGKDIWVLRRPDDSFVAIKNTCPHHGAPICLGRVDGTFLPSEPGVYEVGLEFSIIRCPHHGWEFSLDTGYPLYAQSSDRVVRYDVRVAEGRVLISRKGK